MIAALLLAQAVAAAAPATPTTPATAAVGLAAPDPSAPTPEGLEALRRAFHDSCEVRIYGEYDDLCSGLADDIRHYHAALARAERRRHAR